MTLFHPRSTRWCISTHPTLNALRSGREKCNRRYGIGMKIGGPVRMKRSVYLLSCIRFFFRVGRGARRVTFQEEGMYVVHRVTYERHDTHTGPGSHFLQSKNLHLIPSRELTEELKSQTLSIEGSPLLPRFFVSPSIHLLYGLYENRDGRDCILVSVMVITLLFVGLSHTGSYLYWIKPSILQQNVFPDSESIGRRGRSSQGNLFSFRFQLPLRSPLPQSNRTFLKIRRKRDKIHVIDTDKPTVVPSFNEEG